MKKCLLLGNGPSLANIPNEFLDKYDTFGSNRVYLKYTPDFYACVNPLVIKQYCTEIAQLKCLRFIPQRQAHLVPGSFHLRITPEKIFATKEFTPLYEGYTVTYVLMQIAFWYGYEKVGLLGVDHSYKYDGKPNQQLHAEGKDTNHFDPNYFADGAVWNAPDLLKSEQAYVMAKDAYRAAGREIVNLNPDSKLDVFPKEDIAEW